VPDPNANPLEISTRVNGVYKQRTTTDTMIHSIPTLLEFLTQTVTLHPGDLMSSTTVVGNDRRRITRPAKTKAAPATRRGGFHLPLDKFAYISGSQSPWRMTVLPRARFQNSHQNGGPVFLIFVADPRPCGCAGLALVSIANTLGYCRGEGGCGNQYSMRRNSRAGWGKTLRSPHVAEIRTGSAI
jgi:hypothetical protein